MQVFCFGLWHAIQQQRCLEWGKRDFAAIREGRDSCGRDQNAPCLHSFGDEALRGIDGVRKKGEYRLVRDSAPAALLYDWGGNRLVASARTAFVGVPHRGDVWHRSGVLDILQHLPRIENA